MRAEGKGGGIYKELAEVMDSAVGTLRRQVFEPTVEQLNRLEAETTARLKTADAGSTQELTAHLRQIADVRARMHARLSSLQNKVEQKLF